MPKTIRKYFWYVSVFIKKYKYFILLSIVVSITLSILTSKLSKYLPPFSQKVYIGMIGQYPVANLPQEIINFLNSGLTSTNKQQKTILNLAASQKINKDKNIYTYKLKDGLTWSDGKPIYSQDINISIAKVKVETPDQQTIRFILPAKLAPFPSILSFPITNKDGLLPSPFQVKLRQKSSGDLSQAIIDSGRQVFTLNFYPTASQALTAYKLGQIDSIIGLLQTDSSQDLSDFGLVKHYTNKQKVVLLMINNKDPNLTKKSIRQALAYSLNLKKDKYQKALTTISPDSWTYNPLVKKYLANPQRANELLTTPLDLELATSPQLLPIAEEIKNSINTDKIKIHTKVVNGKPKNFQLYLTIFNIPKDPDQYPFWHSTQQGKTSGIQIDKLDKLLEDGRTTLDEEKRKEIYHEFQRIFSEEVPAIPLFYPNYLDLIRNQRYSDLLQGRFHS